MRDQVFSFILALVVVVVVVAVGPTNAHLRHRSGIVDGRHGGGNSPQAQSPMSEGVVVEEGPFHVSRTRLGPGGVHETHTTVESYPAELELPMLLAFLDRYRPTTAMDPASSSPESQTGTALAAQWCPARSYFEFIPVFLGQVTASAAVANVSGSCFRSLTIAWVPDAVNGDAGRLIISASDAASTLCTETIMFGNREHVYVKEILTHGSHTLDITHWSDPREASDTARHGWSAFTLPCGVAGTVESLWRTYDLFNGRNLTTSNVDFLSRKMNIPFTPHGHVQYLDHSQVRSGDLLAIYRLDGLDPLVMFGTGGRTGHAAMCIWENGSLFVVESTDKNPFGPVYWPPPYGVIRTPFDQWVNQAVKAQFHVALLPLKNELSSQFSEAKAWEFFSTVQGLPYGYHNFVYSFLDTWPIQNLPEPMDTTGHLLEIALNRAAHYLNNASAQLNIYSLIIAGLNMRLGSSCKDMPCINDILDSRDLTLGQVSAIPENDDWVYYDGKSMVCSVFAFEMLRAGLGPLLPTIQGTEQTPKDNYQANLFDGSHFDLSNCPLGLRSTNQGTYCQLMGAYWMDLDGYNSVPIYADMNSHCPSQWPFYTRCPDSNPSCC